MNAMRNLLMSALAVTAICLPVSAETSDEAIVSACMTEVAGFILPEGVDAEVMRPSCTCVATKAEDDTTRTNLMAYTQTPPAERSLMLTMPAREVLWECFNVPESARVVPEGAQG